MQISTPVPAAHYPFAAQRVDLHTAAILRDGADRLEALLAEDGERYLSRDELQSIAAAERYAGHDMSLYFSSDVRAGASELHADILTRQRRLQANEETKIAGLLEIEDTHFVAVHGLIKKNRAVVAAIDSCDYDHWRREPAKYISGKNGTALHWILSGTQKDHFSCAVYGIAALRALKNHAELFDQYLHDALPAASPGNTCVNFADKNEKGLNQGSDAANVLLRGCELLPPEFYQYSQSEATIRKYCSTSPYVRTQPKLGEKLSNFYTDHQRKIIIDSAPVTTNCAIVDLQVQLLREAADHAACNVRSGERIQFVTASENVQR